MSSALAYRVPVSSRQSASERFNAYLLNVDFAAPDGAQWSAVGGGDSVGKAIAAARGAVPAGAWDVAGWNHLYGE